MGNNFNLKAIRSDKRIGYTKGKIYEFIDGVTKWDNKLLSNRYSSYKNFCEKNPTMNGDFILVYDYDGLTGAGLFEMLVNKDTNIGDKFKCSNGEIYEVVKINNCYYTLYKLNKYEEIKMSLLTNHNITFTKIKKEKEINWKEIPKFTKVEVRDSTNDKWQRAYFLRYDKDKYGDYSFVVTQITEEDSYLQITPESTSKVYKYCRLYEAD